MEKRRVMILGVSGSLGSHLASALAQEYHILSPAPRKQSAARTVRGVSWLRDTLDVKNPANIGKLLEEARPNVVVNCVAVTPASPAYRDRLECLQVNSLFPLHLAAAARKLGPYVIHLSTDAVYSGTVGLYNEDHPPDPVDRYGATKLLGELIEGYCVTLRTTFVGVFDSGAGMINWLLDQQDRTINGYANYLFTPLSLNQLKEVILTLIRRDRKLNGLFHLGGEPISKLLLLKRLREIAELKVDIHPVPLPRINRTLNSSRFWEAIGREMPRLDDMFRDLSQQIHACRGPARSVSISAVDEKPPAVPTSKLTRTGQYAATVVPTASLTPLAPT